MFERPENICSYDECMAEFERLFPAGLASEDVVRDIAPAGWTNSPLVAVFHPSLDQVYEESVRIHRNIQSLPFGKPGRTPDPEPTFDEIAASYRAEPVEPERESVELVGRCLWDVFSDNHEVFGADGRVFDIGSFRAAGAFIADYLNRRPGARHYDYMSFFMGTAWFFDRADLSPVYRMIFRRVKGRGLDWRYSFPRLLLFDLRPLHDALKGTQEPEWVGYNPSESLAKEQEDEAHQREVADLRESLDEGHRLAVEEARHGPPPRTVAAYREVYRTFPEGWPPSTT